MDVPSPNDEEVTLFAASVALNGFADDDNASAWSPVDSYRQQHSNPRQLVEPLERWRRPHHCG